MTLEIFADYHTHTRFSHGKGSVAENVAAAGRRGLTVVGITEHGPRSLPWVGARLSEVEALMREARQAEAMHPGMRVLAGMECNIISRRGRLDVPPAVLAGLDIVLAGLHPLVLFATPGDAWRLLGQHAVAGLCRRMSWRPAAAWGRAQERRALVDHTDALVAAVYENDVDIVVHPGYGLPVDTEELARACVQRGTAMELSGRHGHITVEYCLKAARAGAQFVLSSDAHHPDEVGEVSRALALARQAGLGPDQVLNLRRPAGGRDEDWPVARMGAGRRTDRGSETSSTKHGGGRKPGAEGAG